MHRTENLPLEYIFLFEKVAATRSFTKASDALGMAPSTVSQRISQLEKKLGVRLLNRSTRKVALTEAGALFFERCQQIVATARVAQEELSSLTQHPSGHLRVSMPSSFALAYMAPVLEAFSEKYPDITCECDLGIHPVDIIAGSFDVVIRFGTRSDSSIVSRQLGSARLALYASQKYVGKRGMPMVPADLNNHECLRASTSREDSVWQLESGSRIESVAVSGRFAVNNVIMLDRLMRTGAGIAPLPCGKDGPVSHADNLVRILPDWRFAPVPLLAMFPTRMLGAKTRAFVDFVSEYFRDVAAGAERPTSFVYWAPGLAAA